ncbi:hypothetical protein PG993_013664 [Apiospora rasikravindrae]|uniref:Uncharacterized protein n=1 Tax=Apiospora rasikravindrae TaxID=990691 RepID=A0ABR1RQT6_9PEZI
MASRAASKVAELKEVDAHGLSSDGLRAFDVAGGIFRQSTYIKSSEEREDETLANLANLISFLTIPTIPITLRVPVLFTQLSRTSIFEVHQHCLPYYGTCLTVSYDFLFVTNLKATQLPSTDTVSEYPIYFTCHKVSCGLTSRTFANMHHPTLKFRNRLATSTFPHSTMDRTKAVADAQARVDELKKEFQAAKQDHDMRIEPQVRAFMDKNLPIPADLRDDGMKSATNVRAALQKLRAARGELNSCQMRLAVGSFMDMHVKAEAADVQIKVEDGDNLVSGQDKKRGLPEDTSAKLAKRVKFSVMDTNKSPVVVMANMIGLEPNGQALLEHEVSEEVDMFNHQAYAYHTLEGLDDLFMNGTLRMGENVIIDDDGRLRALLVDPNSVLGTRG